MTDAELTALMDRYVDPDHKVSLDEFEQAARECCRALGCKPESPTVGALELVRRLLWGRRVN